jgi:hypothetical protein
MGERLARLPARVGEEPTLAPFDFTQHLVLDTNRIRRRLGHADVVDEEAAMAKLAAGRPSS